MAQITHHCGNPPISVKIRGKTTGRQHDLKGRMPERSEWLLAEGGAKRNPRYRNAHHYASERREYRLPWRVFSRLSDAFLVDDGIPGVTLTLHPRLRATRSARAFDPSGRAAVIGCGGYPT